MPILMVQNEKSLPTGLLACIACPKWNGGEGSDGEKLHIAYAKALHLAAEHNHNSVAFPLSAAEKYGWPRAQALNIANCAIRDFLQHNEMDVYLVLQNHESLFEDTTLQQEIDAYIDDNYVETEYEISSFKQSPIAAGSATNYGKRKASEDKAYDPEIGNARICEEEKCESEHLVARCETPRTKYEVDAESFHKMLFKLIEESKMKNADVYKAANMSKQLFSKIKSNPGYAPTKKTIVSLAIALKLDLEETNKLLMTEGYVLTNCLLFDTIVKYFIENENYSIWEINEVLWEYGFEDKDLFGFN